MNGDVLQKIVKVRSRLNYGVKMTVKGVSMQPTFNDGDKVSIRAKRRYFVGDIVVYEYKNEGFLVHRIIDIKGDQYLCKGDNAIRIEEVLLSNIIGAAMHFQA